MGMIEEILRELGIGANYRAFNLLIVTVSLVVENPDYLLRITKELYPEVGRRCGCAGTAVEHNIMAAARRAWKLNPKRLRELALYPMAGPPTAAEFVDMLAAYVTRTREEIESGE